MDGHDIHAVNEAYKEAKRTKGRPTAILAHTVKGKGVSFMEDTHDWHGMAPNDEQLEIALKELA
ncbi:hypothetical protein RCO48_36615 [Peribacillus frigoritolerans]|nr:hypothetical protein [Peribacillus frigoritolerans]